MSPLLRGSDPRSPCWGERRSRYYFAAREVIGKRVLDVSCGADWSDSILERVGAECVIDMGANARSPRSGSVDTFTVQSSPAHLPLSDHSVEVVTAFDTIGGPNEDGSILRELRRVLIDGGMLIVSCRNDAVAPMFDCACPGITRRYTVHSFAALLQHDFSGARLMGQRVHPRFSNSPFADQQKESPRTLTRKSIDAAIPFALRDAGARLTRGRSTYPGEFDFIFEEGAIEGAHAIMALCKT